MSDDQPDHQPVEDLDTREDDQDQQIDSETIFISHQEGYELQSFQAGPLPFPAGSWPPPSSLGEYNQVLPGLADRIATLVEEEARHRRETETRIIKLSFFRSFAGLIAGFLFALFSMGIAVWLIQNEQYIGGTLLVTCNVVGLTTVFVVGKNGEK